MPMSIRRRSAQAAQRPVIRPDIDRIRDALDEVVAPAFSVPVKALYMRSRGPKRVALARQAAMYLAHVRTGLTLTQAGAMYGRDRTTAAHACRVIEERRDNVTLDFILTAVEGLCGVFERGHGQAAP